MSYAISIGLNIPDRDSDQGPPDPIEPEYDLEGPDFYVTYTDEHNEGNVLFHLTNRDELDTFSPFEYRKLLDTVKEHGPVAIEYGWVWRLEGGEWMFAHKEELAEENACEAYMERIEDDADDI